MAERLLQARVNGGAAVVATSAGTRAVVGYGMDGAAAYVLRALGGDPDGHVARQITPELVAEADLVLAATTLHRSVVIRAQPAAMRRTFTLREFARLGAALPPASGATGADGADDLRRRVADVSGQRGVQPAVEENADDIADPFGAPLPVMERCGQEISAATDAIVRVLTG